MVFFAHPNDHCGPEFHLTRLLSCLLVGFISLSAQLLSENLKKDHPARITKVQAESVQLCLGCHQKIEGKFTHSAIKTTGCVGCHEIKTEGDTTRINLLAEGRALCLMCHDAMNASSAKGRIHSPVADGECTTCHNPHSSTNKFQLAQPISGGKSENLCLMCHDSLLEVPAGGTKHAAVDMGCDTCHVTHKTGTSEAIEFAYHLSQPVPELCLNCHDVKDQKIVTAHRGQPITGSNCVSCHSPHVSAGPDLLHSFSHPPYKERQCDSCHETPRGNKVVLIENGGRALCAICHGDIEKRIRSAKHPHGVFAKNDTCIACHNPHASPFPQHLNQAPASICSTCHQQWAESQEKKKYIHSPVSKEGCSTCHEPHGTDQSNHLRADTNELCLTCHATDAQGEGDRADNTITLFGGAVRLKADYLGAVTRIPVRRGGLSGHPHATHPLGGVPDPLHPPRQMSCLSCHNAHGGNGSNLMLITETKSSSPLCIKCHK